MVPVLLEVLAFHPCTLFDSENDYVRLSPQHVVGADGIGNHIGYTVFKKHTYTFWISFNEQGYTSYHTVPIRMTGRHRLSVCSNPASESLSL